MIKCSLVYLLNKVEKEKKKKKFELKIFILYFKKETLHHFAVRVIRYTELNSVQIDESRKVEDQSLSFILKAFSAASSIFPEAFSTKWFRIMDNLAMAFLL